MRPGARQPAVDWHLAVTAMAGDQEFGVQCSLGVDIRAKATHASKPPPGTTQ